MSLPELRLAQRNAACRVCDETIERNTPMVSWYTHRNCGQHIHIHPECIEKLYGIVKHGIVQGDQEIGS